MSGSTETSSDSKSVSAGFGIIEKIWEAEWALRLVFGLLLLDLALAITTGHSVLTLSATMDVLTKNLGVALTALAASSFFAALVLPALAVYARRATTKVAYLLARTFSSKDLPIYQRRLGCVPAYELRNLALAENSAFLLKLYDEACDRRAKNESRVHSVGLLVFSDLFLAAADITCPLAAPGSSTLLSEALSASGTAGLACLAALVVGACAILRTWWFPPFAPAVIYYPPLDAVLRAREEEGRKRVSEFKAAGRELARRNQQLRADVPQEWNT
jgi:hypothetical protein